MDRTKHPAQLLASLAPSMLALIVVLGGAPGCGIVGQERARTLVPTGFQSRTGPFVVYTNTRLEADASVLHQLHALETQVAGTLGIRADVGDHPIEIYLLDDRQAFDHFLQFHYPDLPRRRAFFLANGDQRVVYTFKGQRTEEDVRHEATHALLHVAVGDMPLWLDEGLAEYFEVAQVGVTADGVVPGLNVEHLDRLPGDMQRGWTPNLRNLEALHAVKQMTPRDYRESWAWVHYLLNDSRSHKAALLAYLGDLRTGPNPLPLSARLDDVGAEALLAHLAAATQRPLAAVPVAPRDPTVRLQSAQIEESDHGPAATPVAPALTLGTSVPVTSSRRRSLTGRLLGWLGL